MKLKAFFKGAGRPSAVMLLAANMVPVWGAIFLGWSVAAFLLLFWTENAILGLTNIIKLLTIKSASRAHPVRQLIENIFNSVIFTVHYGGFCFGHGLGVLLLMGVSFYIEDSNSENWPEISDMLFKDKLVYAIVALFISHFVSLVTNWFIKRERYGKKWEEIMLQPYSRIIALHITIVIGSIIMILLQSPVAGLVLLLAMKTGMDLKAHLKEREKLAPKMEMDEKIRA